MFAFVLTVAVSFYSFRKEGLKSILYGIPLVSLVWRYLTVQLIISFIQMILFYYPIPYQYGIVINTILLGACLVGRY